MPTKGTHRLVSVAVVIEAISPGRYNRKVDSQIHDIANLSLCKHNSFKFAKGNLAIVR
ncbi:hypothetical protein PPACK8108_LOCUS1342 [Phakopsora pachyrhizi]|uniref:Uncharacterized protein n=1 Tax=Phakopsora pachyrhizi TaxID=170000 RepID=A0AAV0AI28_PHAPC|nr:hypothetical protein PPACK8108_LOCUS1342 [Phakopsora pachyrhizi]